MTDTINGMLESQIAALRNEHLRGLEVLYVKIDELKDVVSQMRADTAVLKFKVAALAALTGGGVSGIISFFSGR